MLLPPRELEATDNNRTKAADLLGSPARTLRTNRRGPSETSWANRPDRQPGPATFCPSPARCAHGIICRFVSLRARSI
ncbi:MAG: hypothetical protein IIA44_09925 [Acidobacteria bacterium]|nr:hypothetical protein [Acidobacteriota bacterium]